MKKLEQTELTKLIDLAENELRKGGTITQMVNKIENLSYNRGYRVDRKEVKEQLVAKLASEVNKELQMRVHQMPSTIQ